jgi:fibronectin-binding autotransporter adhesin
MTLTAMAPSRIILVLLVVLASRSAAMAQANLVWDANAATAGSGGSGTWNTTATTWFNGATHGPWSAVNFDNAIFGSTAGTVTLGVPVRAHNLTFDTTGYIVRNSTLTLGGTTPTITTNAALATIGSVIAGGAGLTTSGAGTLVLTGTNTYTGGTTIGAGTLQVGSGGTAGSLGTGNISNNATLVINRSNAVTFGQAISGTGSIANIGNGTTTLTGDNTYSGTTTINAGILQIGSGGTTGTLGTGAVTNNTALRINRSNAITVANDIGGTGTLTKLGAGATTLTGTNTYSGTTTISAGTLQVGNGGTVGTLGSGNITNSAALRINRSDAFTLGQNISGSGTVTQAGSGTTTLTGTNTYSGVTTISGGTLRVGNGGTAGSLGTGAVTNNAVLEIDRSDAVTLAQTISGTGALRQVGTGTTTVTGNNTYIGGTTISAGTLQVGNGGTAGALGSGTITNNAALVINRSNAVTFGQAIGGSGTLTKLGAGTTTLTGANTYIGTTTISAGALQIGNGGTIGALGSGNVVNNASLIFNRSDAITVANNIAGTGNLTKAGAGTTTLTGANTYAGTTTISAGTLQVGNGGTVGTLGAGNITNNAALRINRSNGYTIAQNISGSGTLTQFGAGTTILTGNNTYSGVTTINAGTLQIGNGGTSGTLGTGNITNNAMLDINRSNALTISRVISGTGSLRQIGTGTTTLTGANTYSGTTTISAGVLQVGSGGTAGTLGSGGVINNAGLVFNRSNTYTVGNNISGSGSVTKAGTGTTILSGANTYTGATLVNAGTLRVNGTLGNTAVTVASGATLGGSGTIAGGVTVSSGGRLAPGNSPGTLTVGALNLMSGAIMNYEFGAPGIVGGGINDLIEVNGDVTLDGTLNVSALGGFGIGKYRLMNYTGTLFNNVLDFGVMPAGYAYQLQTAVPGRLTLLVGSSTAGQVQHWDGANTIGDDAVSGGSGVWTAGTTNWTLADGSFNLGWGGRTAIFTGAAGTVDVVGPVTFNGLQFQTSGYKLAAGSGATLNTVTADSAINLNPGVTATIDAPIVGSGGIHVQGSGTLIVTGDNTYAGGTTIGTGSTLQVGDGGTRGSIVGNVNNDGALVINRSGTVAFGGDIAGSGMLRQAGPGTLILTGTNTYTGGTAIAAGSTLQVGDGGRSGSIVGNVANDGTLAFNRADTVVFGGDVTGAGALRQDGAGTLILIGNNTYSGGTTIAAGATLQLGVGGDSGSIIGDVANSGALVFNRSNTIAFGGQISGIGEVRQEGSGTVVLSGRNTYSGGTTIQTGTIAISADENLGSGDLVINGGTLQTTATFSSGRATTLGSRGGTFNTSSGTNFHLRGSVGGGGMLTKAGGGTLTLRGVNTYTGGTRINSGTVSISQDANLGALSGEVIFNGGTLQTTADLTSSRAMRVEGSGTIETVEGSTFLLQSGITGAGALTKAGNGRLVLTAANTYAGGTNVQAGVLQLGNCGSSGSIDGNARVDGALVVSRSDGHVIDGAISGNGALIKDCSGTTILTGANSYAGGTQVNAGTLQGDTNGLQGQISNGAEVVFDQAFDGAFKGHLFGTGTLTKRGTGAVSFAGEQALTGPSTVESGTLALNGTMAGGVHVERDGIFDAAGIVGGSLIVDGRANVSSTESDFGVLRVGGEAAFRAQSTYGVALNAAGQSTALVANGQAGVQGATVAVAAVPGAYERVTRYAVMHAEGGISGVATATSSSAALDPIVSHDGRTLFVTLLNRDVPLQRFATSQNASRLAGALDRLKGGESPRLAAATRELTALDNRTLALALDSMSGEIHTSALHLAAIDGESATDAVRSELSSRMSQQRGETTARTTWGVQGVRSWFRFRGERNSFDSTGAADGLAGVRGGDGAISGFTMGRDWTRSQQWLLGVGGSFASGRIALHGLQDATSLTSPRAVAYAGYAGNGWAMDGGLAVARTQFQTTRTVQFTALAPGGGKLLGGVDQTAVSRPSGIAAELWSEVRLDKRLGVWRVQPTAGLRHARYGVSAYTETGADALSLSASARSVSSLQADMGMRVSRALGSLRPYIGGTMRRELASGQTTAALRFANDPDGFFHAEGLRLSKGSAIGQAGLLFRAGGIGLSMMYEARRTSGQFRQTLQLGFDFE